MIHISIHLLGSLLRIPLVSYEVIYVQKDGLNSEREICLPDASILLEDILLIEMCWAKTFLEACFSRDFNEYCTCFVVSLWIFIQFHIYLLYVLFPDQTPKGTGHPDTTHK